MKIAWNNQYDPSDLAKYIEECKKVDDSGNVSYVGFHFREYAVLFYSMLNFPNSVPENEGRRIAEQAIFKAGNAGKVTPRRLLAEANRLAQKYIQLPLKRYVLITTLSLSPWTQLRNTRMGNATIIFEASLPDRYQNGRLHVVEKAKHCLLAKPPADYLFARVHVSAKSCHEAVNLAFDTLDLIKGILNWSYNRRYLSRISSGKRTPINKIVLGPLHTLHYPSGKPATENWWYQPEYCYAIPPYDPSSQDIASMTSFFRDVRSRLAKSDYQEVLEQAIVRYGRALDMIDWDACFLKLWSVLELLTDSCQDSSNSTIRRTAYIYKDREFALQVLKHLRDHRNRSVHADANSSEIETYLYQLKGFVEHLLSFHLKSAHGFASIKDAAKFLDLPSDKDAIEGQIRLLQYAQRFRHSSPT